MAALLAAIVVIALGQASTPYVQAATFTVNNPGDQPDSNPGNGSCFTAAFTCTLRAAIQEANALSGTHTIVFASSGVGNIQPATALPAITKGVTIDGTTLNGAVSIDGNLTPAGTNGFNLSNGSITLRDIEIKRFPGDGVCITTGGTVTLQGLYIGTDQLGTLGRGNGDDGVDVDSCGTPGNGTVNIGGTQTVQRNVISGNGGYGVRAENPSGGLTITISGNYIGTNPAGTAAIPNADGILARAATIRANVVSGNTGTGIIGVSSALFGNNIGTNAAGTAAIPNAIGVDTANSSNVIGEAGAGGQNVIGGNTGHGVWIHGVDSSATELGGNYIGVRSDGATALANGGDGIHIEDGVELTTLTGVNVIAHNAGSGVRIESDAAGMNYIPSQTRIFSNGGLGIDIGAAGVTANDALDADGGANNLQNFPVLSSALTVAGLTTVTGTLASAPSTSYEISFYASPSCDASGHGEGQTPLGGMNVQTDAGGSAPLAFQAAGLPVGHVVTATASLPGFVPGLGESSEFSACRTVTTCVSGDADCDGYMDIVPPGHAGPANTNTSFDNCIGSGMSNPDQLNADGDFVDLSPPKLYDDLTWPMSDGLGNVCDTDDDNDGRAGAENLPTHCIASDPLLRDTDGDRILDGAECALGTNPTVINAAPASCAVAGDADGDKLLDSREFCYYGTSGANPNSDGDTRNDGCEVYSINGDTTLNVIDLAQIAGSFGAYPSPGTALQVNFDVNKDGNINVLDLSAIAGADPFCP